MPQSSTRLRRRPWLLLPCAPRLTRVQRGLNQARVGSNRGQLALEQTEGGLQMEKHGREFWGLRVYPSADCGLVINDTPLRNSVDQGLVADHPAALIGEFGEEADHI